MPKIKFCTIEDVMELMENKTSFKLVEVLAPDAYRSGHIPSAINIPVDRLQTEAAKKLKKSDLIVVYCGSYSCGASTNAARILLSMGYKKTLDYKASKKGWVDAGLPLVK